MPASLAPALEIVHPLFSPSSIAIELNYEDITELDGEIALIAVDRAGNESAASAPVHVQFDGCTKYLDSDSCIEKEPANCSVRAAGLPEHAVGWYLPAFAASALLAVRRRRVLRR